MGIVLILFGAWLCLEWNNLDFYWRCCLGYNHEAQRDYSITFGAWTSLLWMLFRFFSRNRNWTKLELNSFNKPALTLYNNRHKIRVNHSFITEKQTESDSIYYSNSLRAMSKPYWFGFVMSLSWCGYFLRAWIFSNGKNGENAFEIFLFLLRMKQHLQNSQQTPENSSKRLVD